MHTDETLQFVRRCCILLATCSCMLRTPSTPCLPECSVSTASTPCCSFPTTCTSGNDRNHARRQRTQAVTPSCNCAHCLKTRHNVLDLTMRGKSDLHRSVNAILRLMFLVQPKKFVALVTQALTALDPYTAYSALSVSAMASPTHACSHAHA